MWSLLYKSNLERKPALKRWFISGGDSFLLANQTLGICSEQCALLLQGEGAGNTLRLWGLSATWELEGSLA